MCVQWNISIADSVILLLPLFSLEGHLQLSLALDDGVEIFSANEVCRFLCGETGNEGFYGADPGHQALVDYWLAWEAGELKVRRNDCSTV